VIGLFYNLYPTEVEKTKSQIKEIATKDDFVSWLTKQEIVDKVLNYE